MMKLETTKEDIVAAIKCGAFGVGVFLLLQLAWWI